MLEGQIEFRFATASRGCWPGLDSVRSGRRCAHLRDGDDARYLIVLTPRLDALIAEVHGAPAAEHAAVYRKYESELLE